MFGCDVCIYSKNMHSTLLAWCESFFKLKDQICNLQNRRSGEMANRLFETYKNYVMPHGNHMFQTESGMSMETMCKYL